MSLNDILKISLFVLMLSLSCFVLSASAYLVHRLYFAQKYVIKVDSSYLQDEIVSAVIASNAIQQDEQK